MATTNWWSRLVLQHVVDALDAGVVRVAMGGSDRKHRVPRPVVRSVDKAAAKTRLLGDGGYQEHVDIYFDYETGDVQAYCTTEGGKRYQPRTKRGDDLCSSGVYYLCSLYKAIDGDGLYDLVRRLSLLWVAAVTPEVSDVAAEQYGKAVVAAGGIVHEMEISAWG